MEIGIFVLILASSLLITSGLAIEKKSFPLSVLRKFSFSFLKKEKLNLKKNTLILCLIIFFLTILITHSLLLGIIVFLIGLSIPKLISRFKELERRKKFSNQILDIIMTINSCLKAGSSLLQACEVIAEELPPPACEEFSLVVKETRVGLSLEEALIRLNERLGKIKELEMLINSLLIARETGGDVIKVLNRLAITIRDNRKLKDMVNTLTLQGRLQGLIMSILPFFFVAWVLMFNKHHFDIMFESSLGRMLLMLALVLQVIGMILIKRFSTVKM